MSKSRLETDVVVIGAGVIGLMVARRLSQFGKQVLVCEKNAQPISEASYAGGGIISPLHPWRYSQAMLDLAAWSHQHYPVLIDQLTSATGIHVPLKKTGMLIPDTAENVAEQSVAEKEAALACRFLKAQLINQAQVFNIEPGLLSVSEAIWVPDVHNVRNPSLGAALVKDLQQRGVEILCEQPVLSLTKKDNQVIGVQTTDYQIDARQTVITAGAWSQPFLLNKESLNNELLDKELPGDEQKIFPVKGQMIAFQAKPGVLRSVVLQDHHYLIPRHDGIVLAGSTIEHTGFDQHLTNQAFQELNDFAQSLLPALRYYPIRWHWSGLRPGSKRDIPYIGQVPEMENLYICTGHYRNGLLSAPASAELVSQLMLGQQPIFDAQVFSL